MTDSTDPDQSPHEHPPIRLIIAGEVTGSDALEFSSTAGAFPDSADEADSADADKNDDALRRLLPLEVARIGRSMGHDVAIVSSDDGPDLDDEGTDPWMHGVEWFDDLSEAATGPAGAPDDLSTDPPLVGIISLAAWTPSLGTVRGNIDDPVLQAITGLADALDRAGADRVVLLDVDTRPADQGHELRRNTRNHIESAIRNDTTAQLSLVRAAGPLWTQRNELIEAQTPQDFDELLDEAEVRADADDHGNRLEEVAIATLRTALEDDHRPAVDAADISRLGRAAFVQS